MDEIRGFAVFCMIFFHGFYTMSALFQSELGLFWFRFFLPAEPFFAGAFIFISGVSSNLSRSNLRRGGKLLIVAVGVSLVTALVVPGETILFGILHFLAVCMILFGLYQLINTKRNCEKLDFSLWPLLLFGVLFALTYRVPEGFLGIGAWTLALPNALYQTWLAPLGFPGSGFVSADYFPILPWIFVFLAGTAVGRLAAADRLPAFCYKSSVPALSWLGRHALILYIVHQPIIYGLGCLVQRLLSASA